MVSSTVLKDIGICKQRLLTGFLNNSDICELLINKKNYTEEDVDNLLYTQIFPYLYIDEAQKETLMYLCCDVDIPRIPTGTIKDVQIIVWVYCHKDIMKYAKRGYQGTRADILADMVERQVRDSYDFGIGKPQLVSVTNFRQYSKFYGRQLIFTIPEFKVKA